MSRNTEFSFFANVRVKLRSFPYRRENDSWADEQVLVGNWATEVKGRRTVAVLVLFSVVLNLIKNWTVNS